jgi:hypothetical protein
MGNSDLNSQLESLNAIHLAFHVPNISYTHTKGCLSSHQIASLRENDSLFWSNHIIDSEENQAFPHEGQSPWVFIHVATCSFIPIPETSSFVMV